MDFGADKALFSVFAALCSIVSSGYTEKKASEIIDNADGKRWFLCPNPSLLGAASVTPTTFMNFLVIHITPDGTIEIFENINRLFHIFRSCLVIYKNSEVRIPLNDFYIVEYTDTFAINNVKRDVFNDVARDIFEYFLGVYTFDTMREVVKYIETGTSYDHTSKQIACNDRVRPAFTKEQKKEMEDYGFLLDGTWFEDEKAKANYREYKDEIEMCCSTSEDFSSRAYSLIEHYHPKSILETIKAERQAAYYAVDTKPARYIPC